MPSPVHAFFFADAFRVTRRSTLDVFEWRKKIPRPETGNGILTAWRSQDCIKRHSVIRHT
ncbi:hypothetical protein [Paraburkholderia phenoliruptrix]|uniref:hypothetical protein n=1 Tax=Paraburkholderia phenoliruptrix TaxID=252970 RepID=UPI001583F2B4|nr:hypothetical protein [Paraburkholderia phenoliruptrix]